MTPNRSSSPNVPAARMTVSIVVPILNDGAHLPSCLGPVFAADRNIEVIVIDGGSRDGSVDIARALGVTVLVSPVAQRAVQMNLGAQAADGDVLVFLHSDTVLPADWLATLREKLQDRPAIVGGVFRRRFRGDSSFLRLTCWLADWRARLFGWFLGDQTIFVRQAAFTAAGGYRSMNAFEDLEFSMRLKRMGRTIVLPGIAFSSGRRFAARGPARQTMADLRLTWRFLRHRESFLAGDRDTK